ncbi:hypothetical protein JMJ35_007145 [Cladonia borealis]|uniref:Uncharacterized protein n=1 Tax=Cladonia borealis TaxID=184061 RepID=A0AA39QZR8_9LECA|nr:hypothetical protein JMJ35_007145 [Cladonia borealis]
MATTTSSASTDLLNSSRLTQRRANAASNWKAPGEYTPKCLISSRWGPPMTDDTLLILARANAKLDRKVLDFVKVIQKFPLAENSDAGDITTQVESRHDLADILSIDSQFGAIERGESTFTSLYLVNRHLLYYWHKAFSWLTLSLHAGKDHSIHEPACKVIEDMLRRADELSVEIIVVAENGLLKPEVRTMFGEKWDKVDQLCDVYYPYGHGKAPRTLSTWSALSKQIDRLARNAPPIQSVTAQSTGFWTTTSLLWLTFGGTVLANIPTFALAYGYSEHKPGTVKDADFCSKYLQEANQFPRIQAAAASIYGVERLNTISPVRKEPAQGMTLITQF